MTRDSKPGFLGKRRENSQKAAIRSTKDTYPRSSCVCLLVAQSCLTLWDPMDYSPPGSSVHGILQSKNSEMGCQSLLQGIFLTQALNPGLPHCRQILYRLSHQGSLRIQEWVAFPFSRGSSQPRNRTRILLHCRQLFFAN